MSREVANKIRQSLAMGESGCFQKKERPDTEKKGLEGNRNAIGKPECQLQNQVPEKVLKLARAEFVRTYRSRNRFRDLLLVQLKLCGLKMWLFEMLAAAVVCICLQGMLQDPYFLTARKQIFFLTCFAVSVPVLMLPFLYRSIRYQMFEVECASVFSIRTVLFSKVLVFFGGEVGMIGVLTVFLRWKGNFSWTEIACWVLIPVLFANDGVLALLKRAKPEKMCRDMLVYGGILFAVAGVLLLPERTGGMWLGHFTAASAVGLLVLLGGYGIFEGAGFLRMSEA